MTIPFPCACGKLLSLRDEHASRLVRCPSCQKSFVAPENFNDLRHAPLPRHADGDTYALADEEDPQPPPPPGRAAALPRLDAGNEEASPRLRRRRRRSRETLSAPAAVLVALADLLPPSTAHLVAGGLALLGVVVVILGLVEMRLTTVASSTPQTLTLAQLASRGPGDNAHVRVSDFITCENFVYVVRTSKYAPANRPQTEGWEKVYIPLLPLTPQIKERLQREPNWRPRAAPGQVRVLLESDQIDRESDLDLLDNQRFIQGTIVNEIKSLDSEARERLEESYPGTDFSKCYVLQEGRKPASQVRLLLQVVGGTFAAVVGVLYALLVFLYTTRQGD
jgi:hypothetical protein